MSVNTSISVSDKVTHEEHKTTQHNPTAVNETIKWNYLMQLIKEAHRIV